MSVRIDVEVGYIDTSVLVAIAFGEQEGLRVVPRVRQLDRVYSSNLLEAEFLSVAKRESLNHDVVRIMKPISWVFPARPLSKEIKRILREGYLRGADLWHLATALYLAPKPKDLHFLSFDKRQRNAAEKLGFVTSMVT